MGNKKGERMNWLKFRKFLNDIHLWGGLISGVVVFVVCLTGTIYVYNSEIREAAAAKYYKVDASGQRMQLDSLLTKVKPSIEGTISGISIPFSNTSTIGILFNKNKEAKQGVRQDNSSDKQGSGNTTAKTDADTTMAKQIASSGKKKNTDSEVVSKPEKSVQARKPGGRRRTNQMMVNPYSGELIGDVTEVKTKTAEFMQKMFSLHRWLLLNEIEEPIFEGVENRKLGSWITGTATLLFLLGILSGLVIWFPKKLRGWKNGLKIKWSGNWKRINHDIHNTLGLYTWLVLFLMAITGPFWSFDWYREGWQKTWGTHPSQQIQTKEKIKLESQVSPGMRTLTIDQAIRAVNEALPYEGDITLTFATDSTGTIGVSKNRVGFFAPVAGDRLTLDQYSGEVLDSDIFREKSMRERIGSSLKALHIGNVYGQFSKLLYFIGCLVATSLPVTGVLIWVNKMKKTKKRK